LDPNEADGGQRTGEGRVQGRKRMRKDGKNI